MSVMIARVAPGPRGMHRQVDGDVIAVGQLARERARELPPLPGIQLGGQRGGRISL